MRYFPLYIDTKNTIIRILGGGDSASAKVRLFLKSDSHIIIHAKNVNSDLHHLIQEHSLTWIKKPISEQELANTHILYNAGEKIADATIKQWQQSYRFYYAEADNANHSDFILPAIVDRDPITIAIGTEGSSPVIAQILKEHIADILPASLGRLALWAKSMRQWVKEHHKTSRERRLILERFFYYSLPFRICYCPQYYVKP